MGAMRKSAEQEKMNESSRIENTSAEWRLSTREASLICSSRGYPLSYESLHRIALKYGVGIIKEDRYAFSAMKLTEHLDRVLRPPMKGYIPLKEAVEKFSLDQGTAYYWVKKGFISSEKFGSGRGKIYVRESEIEQYSKSRPGKETNPTA